MKQIFLAIKINPEPELLDVFSKIKFEFEDERIKWADQNQLHLTLCFFGDTDEAIIRSINDSLDELVATKNTFSIGIASPSYFKSKRQLKAVLLSVKENRSLDLFQTKIKTQLQDLGIEKETRKFRAHITLGRVRFIKDNRRFYEFMKKFKDEIIQNVLVDEIVLFESILKQTGSEYKVIKKFKLNS